MRNHSKKQEGIITIQILSSFFILWIVYMFFAICDYQGGADGIFSIFIFQPILGGIFSIIGVISALIIGLPIRLNRKLNNWWRRVQFIPIYLFVLTILMIICSFIPIFQEEVMFENEYGKQVMKMIPNLYLSIGGWFLSGFSVLHFYPKEKDDSKH